MWRSIENRTLRDVYKRQVQDGCNYYCTYCTIPAARGVSRNGSIASPVSYTHLDVYKRQGLYFGSSTGHVEGIADKVAQLLGIDAANVHKMCIRDS